MGGSFVAANSAAGLPRPLKIFVTPFILARQVRAAMIPINKYREARMEAEKELSPDDCGAPFCSAASHTMTNPLRFPVLIVAKTFGLLGRTARGMHPVEGPQPDIHGLIPTGPRPPPPRFTHPDHGYSNLKRVDEHAPSQTGHQTCSPCATETSDSIFSSGRSKVNITKKFGGFEPLYVESVNSSAVRSHLVPFAGLSQFFTLPVKALGIPMGRSHLILEKMIWGSKQADSKGESGLAQPELGIAEKTGKMCDHGLQAAGDDIEYLKNARESLGLGSALMRVWQKFAGVRLGQQ